MPLAVQMPWLDLHPSDMTTFSGGTIALVEFRFERMAIFRTFLKALWRVLGSTCALGDLVFGQRGQILFFSGGPVACR